MNYKTKEEPVVTILIITYNSEDFVLQTLKSAKAQTYSNIQLIISDDGSTDKTIFIIKKWLENNSKYFKEAMLVTTDVNTGINENCNRGLNKAKGEWVKLIAGDDILANDCIEQNIDFINSNYHLPKLIVSQIVPFKNFEKFDLSTVKPKGTHEIFHEYSSAERQFELLIRGKFINGASAFYNLKILREMGGFTNQVRSLEDYPTFLYFTLKGNKIYFLKKATVYYRIHEKSESHRVNGQVLSLFIKDVVELMVRYSKLKKSRWLILNSYWNKYLVSLIFIFGNRGKLVSFLNYCREKFSPIRLKKVLP